MSGSALRRCRSSYSGSDGGNGIEAAQEPTAINLRDAKAPHGHVTVGPGAWTVFLGAFGAR
ncbi:MULTISPECIES: DUF397 domain-containing protein [Streptomyces]|uniref:DUF397 domain-containing protein n=1 Tax=Streptomyces tendae TaxID=1932 RepID=UPI0038019122